MLLAGATVVAYLPVLEAGFVWDDDLWLTANPNIGELGGLARIWLEPSASTQYYPLTYTSFWVENELWGLDPVPFHVTNVLLHAAAAVLLWLVLERLRVPGALAAAAVFALHPVHVESVAWITERKNVFAGALALAAALAWFRFAEPEPAGGAERGRRGWSRVGLPLVLFAGALAAKTAVAPLPFVLALLTWWRRGRLAARELAALFPFAALALGAGLMTRWIELHRVGAGSEWDLSPAGRLILAGRAAWFYAGKLVWPLELAFVYPRFAIEPAAPAQYLWPVTALALPLVLWSARRSIGRGPFVAVLCYALLLAPALGFFDVYFFVYSWVQDHFQYFASMAGIPLLVAAAARGLSRAALPRRALVAAACLLVVGLGGTTWQRAATFSDSETLYRTTLEANPEAWLAHHNLGNMLVAEGKIDEGLEHLREAVRIYPGNVEGLQSVGSALLKLERPDEALEWLERALELRPDFVPAQHNLVHALTELGRLDAAVAAGMRLTEIAPDDALAHHKLAGPLLRLGRLEQATLAFERAVALDPDVAELRTDLAMARAMAGRNDEALRELEHALRLAPRSFLAQYRRGLVLLALGEPAPAAAAFRAAIAERPGYAQAHRELAEALARLGDDEGARRALAQYRNLAGPGTRSP